MPYCCGRYFNANGYNNHIACSAAHADDHECNYCYESFRWEENRDKHEKQKHWHHCQSCNWKFKFPRDLNSHVLQQHPKECDICDKKFGQQSALDQHMNTAVGHQNYCYQCKRAFINPNALKMVSVIVRCGRSVPHSDSEKKHLKSSVHKGRNVKCPWCPDKFTNLTGVTLHLESGRCPSGIDRQKIDNYCRQVDRDHVFTNRQIEWPTSKSYEPAAATNNAWNEKRGSFVCCICHSGFSHLAALNQHLNSPVHQQKIYHCPRCKVRFVALSALVNHLESESCGPFRSNAMAGSLGTVANRFMITQ